jgi:Ca2+-binding RTX toxin-like protein
MPTLTIDGTGGNDSIVVTVTGPDSGSYTINGGAPVAFSGVTQVNVNGLAGNDTLTMVNPFGLAAVLSGGADDDTYFVDHANEAVVENPGEGTDTVNTSINYTLGPNVEKLTLLGSANLQGYGNNLPNTITGNDGHNLIDGQAGADVMIGGAGHDTYFVDDPGDAVFENANEGTDTVFSTANFALPANLDTLVLQGSADLQGFGNSGANTLFGNSGNNLLDGGAGVDRMDGGFGNDTYFVDNASERVNEADHSGSDTIFSSISLTLPAYVETLVLLGSADLQGAGQGVANSLFGNSGNNVLDGGALADYMQGGAGNDTYFVENIGDVGQRHLRVPRWRGERRHRRGLRRERRGRRRFPAIRGLRRGRDFHQHRRHALAGELQRRVLARGHHLHERRRDRSERFPIHLSRQSPLRLPKFKQCDRKVLD